jgi:transmembrane sensor
MMIDRFIELFVKSKTSLLSEQEKDEFDRMIHQPEHADRFQVLERFWSMHKESALPDVDAAFAKVLDEIGEIKPTLKRTSSRTTILIWSSIAAVLIVVAAIAFTWNRNKNSVVPQITFSESKESIPHPKVEKQNSKGIRSVILLADGTKVWLNADSKLQYPESFGPHTRDVTLIGEAFFEVTKNPRKPFIIRLQNGTVKVLGTSFNIKAYPGDRVVETSVSNGRVAFVPHSSTKGVAADTTFLTKNVKAIYTIETGEIKTIETTATDDRAWTEGKLIFRNTGMEDIAHQLERYFGKEVIINDEEVKHYHLTGTFTEDSAEQILYYLSKTKPFTYTITESQIIISLVH